MRQLWTPDAKPSSPLEAPSTRCVPAGDQGHPGRGQGASTARGCFHSTAAIGRAHNELLPSAAVEKSTNVAGSGFGDHFRR